MAKDWTLIAKGLDLHIPDSAIEKAQAALEALDSQFLSLVRNLPHETEPVFIYPGPREELS